MPKQFLVGCIDGCGTALAALDAKVAEQRGWLKVKAGWRCPPCQRELAAFNRYREAMGRAYGNRV